MPDNPSPLLGHCDSRKVKLTGPQRELLSELAGYEHGEGYVRSKALRTSRILVDHGLLKRYSDGHWHKVTDAGKAWLDG